MGKTQELTTVFVKSEPFPRGSETVREWHWTTCAANGNKIGVGGEGYGRLDGAINGFLGQQGFPGWKPGNALPEGYTLSKVTPNRYIMTHTTREE